MKKLSKIKLLNAVVLENSEMKAIYGGSGSGGNGDCDTHGSTCSGKCYISGTLYEGNCEWIEITGGLGGGAKICGCVRIVS